MTNYFIISFTYIINCKYSSRDDLNLPKTETYIHITCIVTSCLSFKFEIRENKTTAKDSHYQNSEILTPEIKTI